MNKSTKLLSLVLALLILVALALGFYVKNNFRIWNGMFLSRNVQVIELKGKALEEEPASLGEFPQLHTLDARGCRDYEKLAQVQAAYPELEVLYTVAIDATEYQQDAQKITVSAMTGEEEALLAYLPRLKEIDGSGCQDYAWLARLRRDYPQYHVNYSVPLGDGAVSADAEVIAVTGTEAAELLEKLAYLPDLKGIDGSGCADYQSLARLKQAYPGCSVAYAVALGQEEISADAESVSLFGVEVEPLQEKLAYLPRLRQVRMENPVCTGQQLKTLVETYPDIDFAWEMDVFGVQVTSADTEVDLSGVKIPSLEAVEEAMACFPAVELLYLGEQDVENATMAAFREKMRSEYKVAWMMTIGYVKTRSDATTFFPKFQGLTEQWSEDLKYCEDMICVDVGHKPILTVTWAAYMPHLRYLIIADTSVRDLSPLSGLKELVYLEAFQSPVKDYSPLLGCTALEDLNISNTRADKEPLLKMTWLKRLWWAGVGAPLEEFREALPNTELMFAPDPSMGYGWRKGYLYFEMRDTLGEPYMDA